MLVLCRSLGGNQIPDKHRMVPPFIIKSIMDKINYLFLLLLSSCFVFISCSKDDEQNNGDERIGDKRIKEILRISKEATTTVSFFYNSGGITQIVLKVDEFYNDDYNETNEIIDYAIAGNAISWSCDNERNIAYLTDGRANSMTMKECTFSYNSDRKLTEIRSGEWHEILKLTWERNNIAKIERFENDGSFIEKIEYSYTNYRAHMLGFFLCFNPFTEFDFLDGISEAALFYTNACGTLSFNLPSKAIFFNSKNEKATRTYKYETDHSGYPISVTINGEGYDSDFYDYPINMAITWE